MASSTDKDGPQGTPRRHARPPAPHAPDGGGVAAAFDPDSIDGEALAIAIGALSYFATEPKIMDRFFALTGVEATSLRDAAGTPGFVTGVLDFVLSDEALLEAVAAEQETSPAAIADVRARLERRPDEDWPPRPRPDAASAHAASANAAIAGDPADEWPPRERPDRRVDDDDWPPRVPDDHA